MIDFDKFTIKQKTKIDFDKFIAENKETVLAEPLRPNVNFKLDLGQPKTFSSTPQQDLSKRFFEPTEEVRARDVAREVVSTTKKVISTVGEFGKAILRAPQRALTSVGLQPVADILGKEAIYKPETKFEKFIFGEEPVKGVLLQTKDAEKISKELAAKAGFNESTVQGMSLAIAPLFTAGMITADLAPIGGGKNVFKSIAKSKNSDEILVMLRQIFKKTDIEKLKPFAKSLVKETDEKAIKTLITDINKLDKFVVKQPKQNINFDKFVPEKKAALSLEQQISKAKAEGRSFEEFVKGGEITNNSKIVWQTNLEGGQKIGNKQILRKPTIDDFQKEILPRTREGYYEGKTIQEQYQSMLKKEPNIVISFIDKGNGWEVSKIDDLVNVKREIENGIEQGWARVVSDFNEPISKYFRQTADSQIKTKSQLKQLWDKGAKPKVKKEKSPLPQIPKETKAIVAEKARQKIKSAKDILDRRRSFIRATQKQFGLSDADLRKITQKDIRLMNNIEYKKFLDDLKIKSAEFAETRQAKNQVLDTIRRLELKKVDNLRKSMELPPINKMTIKQLGELDDILSKAEFGDVFLTQRQLETVSKTDLAGIKTIREAKEALAKELNIGIDKLDNIKVGELDRLRFDTSLAERNDFYKMMVENTHKGMLDAEKNFLNLEDELNDLVIKARKSRPRSFVEKLIPTDKKVFDYLSGNTKLAKEMTKEELELANYLQVKFADALDYLVKNKVLTKGREDYITNVRRGFLEAIKDDGLKKAIKEIFDKQKADLQVFQILDSKTGDILPLEKFFQFSLKRNGAINPTKNVAKAATTYFKTLEKKKALDSIVPKLMIYVDALTPSKLTPKGLEMDTTLRNFVKEWLNTKRGRKVKLIAKQGGKIDIALNTIRGFLYFKDLAMNLPVGVASLVGEQIATFVNIGNRLYTRGIKRYATRQGKKIIEEYKNFIGKNVWSELAEPSKNVGDKFTEGMFGLFQQSTVEANKIHLLGSLTDEEFKLGKISAERLAQMKLEIGRLRMLQGGKSIIGSTAEGQILTQYKTWAIPIFRTISKDLSALGKQLASGNFKKAVTSKELREVLRAAEISGAIIFLGHKFVNEDDNSFIGNLTRKLYREALTILGALDTKTMLAAPRLVSFVENLGEAISNIVKLEEYKTKPGYKGIEQLKTELTPRVLRQFKTREKTTSLPGLPALPKLPVLPGLS